LPFLFGASEKFFGVGGCRLRRPALEGFALSLQKRESQPLRVPDANPNYNYNCNYPFEGKNISDGGGEQSREVGPSKVSLQPLPLIATVDFVEAPASYGPELLRYLTTL